MDFYIDCIHTDICEQSVITCRLSAIEMLITQIQAHSPQNTQTYMKTAEEEKKEMFICAKKIAKLRPITSKLQRCCFFGLKVLDGMLFSGPLSFKLNQDLQQWIRLRVVIRMNMVCTAFFLNMF